MASKGEDGTTAQSGPPAAALDGEAGPSVAAKVVALLGLLSRADGGIGAREAERETGIDRSAVSRLFRQLRTLGWLSEIDDRGEYTVGPEFFAAAAAVRQRDSLGQAVGPLLTELAARFNETTYATVRRGDRVVFVHKIDSTQRIRYVVDLNEPYPLTTGAAGRAILSALPVDEIERILGQGLTAHTARSITDPAAYRAQLREDAELGYAYSQSGWVAQGAGVASPYFDATGECQGAVTVSAPIDRLSLDVAQELGPAVLAAARRLSHRLGYSGPPWGPSE